jgi:TatA/E family protein of Tat protein translocase
MPFGLSPVHLLVVLGIALVALGPRRLPHLGSAAGKTIREFRAALPATRDAFVDEASAPTDDAGRGHAIGSSVGGVAGRSVRGAMDAASGAKAGFQNELGTATAGDEGGSTKEA